MMTALPVLDSLFDCIDTIRADQCAITDPDEVKRRLRLVQDLVARLPHKFLLSATKEQIQAAGRTMMLEGRAKAEMKALQATLVALLDLLWQRKVLPRHPLRPGELRRSLDLAPPEAAMTVGLNGDVVDAVRGVLGADGIVIHEVSSLDSALDRLSWYPFSFILMRHPFHAPAEFFDVVRGPSSMCRTAGVVLLSNPRRIESAKIFQGRGANRVLEYSLVGEELGPMVAELSTVSERIRLRVPVKAEDGGDGCEWQSENISISGMLVRVPSVLDIGTEVDLEFTLPGDNEPVRVAAEVVRKTTFGREDFEGMGLRFLCFLADGQHRVEVFLRQGL